MSCELIYGYELEFYSPQSVHQNVLRRVGANGTFYIIKDEDKLAMAGSEDTHVTVLHTIFLHNILLGLLHHLLVTNVTVNSCRFEPFTVAESEEYGLVVHLLVSGI